MDLLHEIRSMIFLAAGFMTILSAVMIIFFDHLLHEAISLFFTLIGIALLYILLGADFLGVSQVLIYAGGVLVLIIFGIFLTTPFVDDGREVRKSFSTWVTIFFGFLLFRLLYRLIHHVPWVIEEQKVSPTTKRIGEMFLSEYLLPFELISFILLFVLIGSILIIRKDLRKP